MSSSVQGLSAQQLKNNINKVYKESQKPKSPKEILNTLLERVDKVDYRGIVNSSKALKKKHYVIITVDEILQLAERCNWGLCRKYDFTYIYNGMHWTKIDKDDLKHFLGEVAQKMGTDRFDAKYYHFKDELLKQFIASAYLQTPDKSIGTTLINLENGTLELTPNEVQTLNLREFRQEDFLTYQLPFDYDPGAKAPLFHKYLNEVLPYQKMQSILAEYIGYIFIDNSHLKLEKALILYGSGANGKSVFFEIVNALLGKQNVSTYSLQSLTNEKGYYRARIADKLVNYASEINGNLEASIFKQLVSGEPVEARLPHGKPFIIDNYAKLIFNCNELPRDVEHTHAFFRRFLIVPFEVTIPENKQDKHLAKKIINNELSGVYNWILEGLKRLVKQGDFTHSEKVEEQSKLYKKESDSVAMFIDAYNYKVDYDSYTTLKILYREYKEFCYEDGYRPVSKRNFSKRLRANKIETKRKSQGIVAYITNANF